MTATVTHRLPMVIAEVEAVEVERLSPSFVRVALAGADLADFGVAGGKLFDQRVKLVFPPSSGVLPSFAGADETWLTTWLGIPEEERGHMRTYTVRDVRGSGPDTQVLVDFVLHEGPGSSGPGSRWAAAARAGDRLVLVGPRKGDAFGGIEFDPDDATNVLLVGDETAVPAIAAILRDLDPAMPGAVFVEVPVGADVVPLPAHPRMTVAWLPRDGSAHGTRMLDEVRRHLGLAATDVPVVEDAAVDPDLWETPHYSSSGEELTEIASSDLPGLYAWIAGESKAVTTLRRVLVREVELDRRQVAFMGYWRSGVPMRS